MIRKIFTLLIFVMTMGCSPTVRQIDLYSVIPADTTVRVGTLANGMRYYIRRNCRPEGQANFYIYHNVGAIDEEESQNGLAHFLEHMAFNGTVNLPGKTIIDYLETIGVKFGAELNASTGHESTSYMMTNVPLLREGIIDTALLILHDWSGFIALDADEIDKERGVIIEELRGRLTAERRTGEASWPLIYNNSLYAYRNVIGSEKLLRTFKHETLRDFYRTWYRPDLQAVVIVGDINVDEIEQKIIRVMADIPSASNPQPKVPVMIPVNEEPIIGVFTDPELTACNVTLYIRRKPFPRENNDKPISNKTSIEEVLIRQMIGTRLNDIALKPEAPFLAASTSNGALTRTSDVFTLSATARPNEIAQTFEALYTEVERIRLFGFNPGEFANAKAQMLRSQEKVYDSRNDRKNGDFINSYINNFIHNSPMASPETIFMLNTDIINAITLEEVNARISEILPYYNEVVVATGPEKDDVQMPTVDELGNTIASVQTKILKPYPDEVVSEPLISGRLRKGKVTSEEPGRFGSTVWTLNNGIKVVLLPTDYKADQFYMNISSLGGISMIDDDDYTSAQVLTSLAAFSGVGKFTASELRKRLSGKIVSLNMELDGYSNGFSTGGSSKDMESIFQLSYLFLTSPRFKEDSFNTMMDRLRAQYINAEVNPASVLSDSVQSTLYPGVYRHTPFRNRIDLIDFNRMPAIYNKLYGNPQTFTFIIVGDFDHDAVKPLVEKYVGSLRGSSEKNIWVDRGNRMRQGRIDNFFSTRMETPKSTVLYLYSGEIERNMNNILAMDLLTRILDIRYNESIREEKGGTYGVSTNGTINELPNESYNLQIQFTTDPEMATELMEIVSAEIEKIAKEGPREEDIGRVKEHLAKSRPEGLKSNVTWMRYLLAYYVNGHDNYTDYDRIINEVNGQSIQALANKILYDDNLIRIVMSPEK